MGRYKYLWSWAFLIAIGVGLASCKPEPKVEAPEIRPVRTVIAAKGEAPEIVMLTGHIRAEDEPALAFRVGGRVIERPLNPPPSPTVEPTLGIGKRDPASGRDA